MEGEITEVIMASGLRLPTEKDLIATTAITEATIPKILIADTIIPGDTTPLREDRIIIPKEKRIRNSKYIKQSLVNWINLI